MELVNFSQWHISVLIRKEGKRSEWVFTGFYGHSDASKRKLSWDLLTKIRPSNQMGWCVAGDYNEVLVQSEKCGGNQRSESQMAQFREALENNSLSDLGCRGGFFTWSNRHADDTFTKERLDKCVANNQWRIMYKEFRVKGLAGRCFNHLPLLLSLMGDEKM